MQREIRFRIWSKHQNKFIINPTKYERLAIGCDGGVYSGKYDCVDMTDEHMIMQQYTGLKDKNNKEIYEGDIIQYLLDDKKLPSYPNGEVYYDNGSFQSRNSERLLLFTPSSSLIVGNIFENPDLIK